MSEATVPIIPDLLICIGHANSHGVLLRLIYASARLLLKDNAGNN